MRFRKIFFFVLVILINTGFLSAEDLARKNYESKNYKVQMKAILNDKVASRFLNIVEVVIYDKTTKCFWYERFIIDGDKDYLLSEYETNPDLNIAHLDKRPITDWDIDQFASEKMREIADVGRGLYPQNYGAFPHDDGTYSYMAYSRTTKDIMRMQEGIGK